MTGSVLAKARAAVIRTLAIVGVLATHRRSFDFGPGHIHDTGECLVATRFGLATGLAAWLGMATLASLVVERP